mgnify:CR=1 FL=1
MAEDKYVRMAHAIYDQVGGPQNVVKLIHCTTRVRLTIRDESIVVIDGLKAIDGVLGVVQEETLQVVVGPGAVDKVAAEMLKEVGVGLGEPFPAPKAVAAQPSQAALPTNRKKVEAKANQAHMAQQAKLRQSSLRQLATTISSVFVPLIPVFIGAGLISGVAAILSNLMVAGDIGKNWSDFINILKVISNGLFSYVVVYVGINSATVFGATAGLGGVIGAVTLLVGITPGAPIQNSFNGQALSAGQGGIIGVIFAVWVLSIVEKWLHQVMPDSIDSILTPMLTLLVTGVFTICLVMPIAGVISTGLVCGIEWVLNVGGAFSGFMLGAFFLPLVMTGLHQLLLPIHIEMINQLGFTPLLPIFAMAGAGQVGAAFALWFRCRNNQALTGLIKGALPVGILGIGEPLMYGVTLPLGRPFITACIGGGIGGAVIVGFGHIGAMTIGLSGAALIPLITNGHWLGYVIGLLAAYAGGFVATYFFGVPKDATIAKDKAGNLIEA